VREQQQVYNGHKRIHGVKYTAIVTPDGLISSLSGPFVGRRHDLRMYVESRAAQRVQGYLNNTSYYVLGDKGYKGLMATRPTACNLKSLWDFTESDQQKLSKARVSAENLFAEISRYFKIVNQMNMNESLRSSVGQCYVVAALLTNCHSCLYSNPVNSLFDTESIPLETYLADYEDDVETVDFVTHLFDPRAGFFDGVADCPDLSYEEYEED